MRSKSDEVYVLDLIAEILDEDYVWQKRFMTLVGDLGKYGRSNRLPVDAFFPDSKLIVEYKKTTLSTGWDNGQANDCEWCS